MGVELDRQVQVRVDGMQVGVTSAPVGQPSDLDLAEHGQQSALVASLDAAPGHSVSAYHRLHARLPLRPQVQVVLEHLAEQLAALHVQALFQFAMGELARIRPLQPVHDPLESIAGGGEGQRGLVLNAVGVGGEWSRPPARCPQAGPFPSAPPRTRRASFPAPGSPVITSVSTRCSVRRECHGGSGDR